MTTDMDTIKATVENRIREEAATAPATPEKKTEKIPVDFLLQCLRHNRIGDAALFAELFQGQFIYVKLWGRWLYWNGHHWMEDIENLRALTAINRVCEEYQRILFEHKDAENPESSLTKAVNKRLNLLRDTPARERLLTCSLLLDENPMYINGDELDKQEYLMACTNGVVDLRTGERSDGDPWQYILNYCPTKWKGLDEPSPIFMHFLNSSFDGDQEMVRYMLRLLGYGLLGSRDEHIWSIFHGPRGRNGKDTLMKIIQRVVGARLAIKIPTALLMQQTFQRSGSQPEPDIMALRGAKFAFASEGEASQRIAMSKLKDITGGSIITARGLQDKLMTSWEQTHLLFFLTNELPKMKADDEAFWTRLHAIHWPIRFVDNPKDSDERPRDPRMLFKLSEEGPGILARLVEGCMDYLQRGGLHPPDKVIAYTSEQREQFDDIGRFIAECCLREDPPVNGHEWKTRMLGKDFVLILNWWSQRTLGAVYPFSAKRVTQSLEKRGIQNMKSSITYYLGITIRDEIRDEYIQHTGNS